MGGHTLGGAHGHIKVRGLFLFPHQKNSVLRLIGPIYLTCRYARENTAY